MVFKQAVPDLLAFIFHPDMSKWKTEKPSHGAPV